MERPGAETKIQERTERQDAKDKRGNLQAEARSSDNQIAICEQKQRDNKKRIYEEDAGCHCGLRRGPEGLKDLNIVLCYFLNQNMIIFQ